MPALIARIPEPEPDPEADPDAPPRRPTPTSRRCRGCPGSWRVAAALGGFAIGGGLGWEWPLLFLVPLVPVLIALALIDWRTHLLPDPVVWPTTLGTAALVGVAWLRHRRHRRPGSAPAGAS